MRLITRSKGQFWGVLIILGYSLILVPPCDGQKTDSNISPTQIDSALTSTRWAGMKDIVPRHYVALRTNDSIVIDGRITEMAWKSVSWSELYVDIEGSRKPQPRFDTRMKITWDEQYLYIAAELEEPHLWATLTEKNSVIFYDHDFEVFVDPNADNHNYYEFEVNAFNTIWELRLGRPYRDQGPIIDPQNMSGVLSAIYLDGTLNDPSDTDIGWSVELAFPWEGFASYGATSTPPAPGDQWRFNFSRVERQVESIGSEYVEIEGAAENNWVWSAQGAVAMHMPERWGYVQFSDPVKGEEKFRPDPTFSARELLMEIYYMEKAYQRLTGEYTDDASILRLSIPSDSYQIEILSTSSAFDAFVSVTEKDQKPLRMSINDRGRLHKVDLP